MPLPASILNETNRTLQEQLDRVTGDLFERQREVAEHKDSLTFMREHLSQIQYQSNVINDSLRHRTEDLRKTASEITQMKNENDSLGRAVKTSQSESKRVTNLVSSLITTVTSVRHEVLSKLEESKDLECDAKELVTVRLMKEEQGSSLEASLQKFSESVWTKLELLEAQTAQQEKALSFSHDEQAAAIRELEVAQLSLQESIADQKESLRALELVQRQVASLDRSIEVNASTMAHLKSKYRNRESVRESLRASLEIFSAEYKELSKQLHEKENSANRYLHDIQTLSVFLRNQLLEMKRMQRGVSADRHRLVQMRRSMNNFTVLCEERQLALDEHREVYRGMQQMNGRTLEAAESDGRSFLSSLHDMREKLERRLVMTGNRYLRAQQKVSAAMNELCQIGHIANETNDTVQLRVAELRTLQGAHHNAEEELSRLVEHSSALEDSVQAARLLISTAKEQKLNDHMLFQADTVERIQLLRDDLEEMRDRHRRLLSETISLRASMRRATAQYLGSTLSGEQLSEQCRLLADEVSGLERERGDTEVHRKIQEERLTTHDASLSVLRQALQSRVEDLKGAAQLPEILRDEILREEEVIRVDMESSMLELHLEQNALHEHKEELQGLKKKKELLQMRYNETMTSMSRVLCANGPAVLPMESCAIIEASDLRPEALHARLLLQRSSEREQLMNRGNYLDLRLLTVEKETRMLERALQSLREESNGASSIALPKTSTSRSRSDISEFNAHLDEVVFLSTNTLTTELKLQDEVMKEIALNRHSNKLHLSNLRQTLREMQATVKQKRTQARRLQEEFHRQNSMTNLCVAATRF